MVQPIAGAAQQVAKARHFLSGLSDTAAATALWLFFAAIVVWGAIANVQLVVIGVIVGSIFALGAIGLTLIYGIMKFAHFAHGDMMMFAAYLAFFALTGRIVGERTEAELGWSLNRLPGATTQLGPLSFGYGLLLAMLLALIAIVAIFIALDQLIYRRLRERGSGIVIFAMVSLGIAIAVRSVILILWGAEPRFYVTGIYPAHKLPFGIYLKADQIFIIATAAVVTILTYLLLFRTRIGKAMRATSDNPDLARVSGIDTDQVIKWTWAIGGALVAVAGVLLAIQSQLKPELGFTVLLPLFAAAILGGIGSPQGALVGAMIVGIVQELSVGMDLSIFGTHILPLAPGYKFAVAFVILILMLLVRPRGLFGAKT
jgi:branched-chain amino acid transport system permease protein/neutral amino acid transport system permease protein